MALSEKRQRFVDEYLVDLNGARAARSAGYSERTANRIASTLLSKVDIQQAIEAGRARTAQVLELRREDVLRQLQRIGFSDPRKFFDEQGRVLPITNLDDDTAAALQSFEVEMRQLDGADMPAVPVLKVRFSDRKAALDAILKAQGWNSAEKYEHTGKGGGPIQTETRVVIVPAKNPASVTQRTIPKDTDA